MDRYAKLKDLLRGICRTEGNGPALLFQGEVVSVEKDCCTVEVSGLQLTDVRLKAIADGETEKALLVVPSVGSRVLVGSLTGDLRDLAVLNVERFDRMVLGGKDFGGLVKATVLTERLNALEKEVNDLKAVFSGWEPVAQDGGSALKTAAGTWAGNSLQVTQQADIENDKILQG